MRKIHADEPFHAEIIIREIDQYRPFRFGYDRMLSFTCEGKLLGGILYDNFAVRSVHMHIMLLDFRMVTRRNLFASFHYPFLVMGCEKVFGPVWSTNRKGMDFAGRVGFKEETRLKGAIPDGDLVIWSMTRQQCKWIGET
jgi:hypothetical protein